jgi:hypothetical protein
LSRYPQNERVQRSLRLLAACRTAALGGHATRCDHCGVIDYHYHSCGDRHCPQCGGLKRARWLAQRQAELLDVPYFHLVFTLPHELSALALGNRKLLYGLLFAASAQTLLTIGADPKHLGVRLGAIAVLHTWGQKLDHHPHVHMIVPGGGLACNHKGVVAEPWRWQASRPNFLLPVRVLSKVFRGKYLEGLRQAYDNKELQFAGTTAALANQAEFATLLSTLYRKNWVVYAKKPFAGPTTLLKYLTRYTHRVALTNDRLVKLRDDAVTLTYKDYTDGCQRKETTLGAVELLRRFALHIVPGIVRIRHYGILTHRSRGARLAKCRALVAALQGRAATEPASPLTAATSQWSVTSSSATPLAAPLLLAVLTSPSTAGPTPSTAVTAAPTAATDPVPLVKDNLCPICRQGKLETFWFGERPKGRDFELAFCWNTS